MRVVWQMNRWQYLVLALLFAALPLAAQTNTPSLAPAAPTDPELFFAQYRQAASLLAKKQTPQAIAALETLTKKLNGSPWLDIALLKYAELLEHQHETAAMEAYTLLRQRLQNAPYFQGQTERAVLFANALGGAINAGINRLKTTRLRAALDKYFARHTEYPESLAKLSVLGYVEPGDTLDAEDKPFRYLPTGMVLAPFISYKRYEGLAFTPPEPLVVASPKIEATSLDEPGKYTALLLLPGKSDYQRIVENQILAGCLVIAIANDGVILTNRERVLVLLTPKPASP